MKSTLVFLSEIIKNRLDECRGDAEDIVKYGVYFIDYIDSWRESYDSRNIILDGMKNHILNINKEVFMLWNALGRYPKKRRR